ncbi:MAG: relaxase domain-containing protein, partial [Verrucomicrobiota bacterium]|nr:relaxase domain-containing protein [Verrucomicrobiota bacterium]
MLSPKTQTNLANARGYFEEHLCVGDYYAASGRVQGLWIGKGAVRLGLTGAVTRDAFLALCENQHPTSGERLTQRHKTTRRDSASDSERANRRVFFDFTISPPKSVSIAALVANDTRIVEAHRGAIAVAVTELEQFAAARLRQHSTNSDRRTDNIVAALFEHETSRALDPHLHTHCIVFNATHDDTEQRWKALENHDMLAAQKYVENVYYHELARALRAFGYTIINAARGDFELAEVSAALRERFSKRHRQIDEQTEAFLAVHPELQGANVQAIREHLAHKARDRKVDGISDEQLRNYWSEQVTDAERAELRFPAASSDVEPQRKTAADAISWAEEHLFERRSVVHEYDLWRHALVAARGAAVTVQELKNETTSRSYLRAERDKVSRRDVLAREWAIVEAARDGVGRHAPLAFWFPAEGSELAPDQLRAFRQILGSTDFITLFRGGAGTGKSFVLRRIQGALRRGGNATRVAAPQRQQVADLSRDGLQETQTVAELLQRGTLPDGAVLIVDEAGQISGRQMLDLLRLVRETNGRVILSGDTRQHGPVEASDALRAIERYSGVRAAELNEIRRQDPARAATAMQREQVRAYRRAVEVASEGELAASLQRLEKMGAVVECGLGEQRERLADTYLAVASRGESAIVVSQTRAEVREINEAVRARLRSAG